MNVFLATDDPIQRARAIEHAEAAFAVEWSRHFNDRAALHEARMQLRKSGVPEWVFNGQSRSAYTMRVIHRPDCWLGLALVQAVRQHSGMDIAGDVLRDAEMLRHVRDFIECEECQRLFDEDSLRQRMDDGRDDDREDIG